MEIKFSILYEGMEYQCTREINGKNNHYWQTVRVDGIMDKEDETMTYDDPKHPAMQHGANSMARTIIRRQINRNK